MIKEKQIAKNTAYEELTQKVSAMPQPDCPMNHIFPDKTYIRQRLARAGTLLIGKRHRHETTSILLSGNLSIYLEDGDSNKVEHKTGPCIWITPAGSRRITYSKTDTVLATVHPNENNETDLDKLENEATISEEDFLRLKTGGPI